MADDPRRVAQDSSVLYTLDNTGQVHPVEDQAVWDEWMAANKGTTRYLFEAGILSIGVRFLGKDKGLDKKTFQPFVWQAVFLVNDEAVASLHATSFDNAVLTAVNGIKKAIKSAPWQIRLRAWWLILKVKWQMAKVKMLMLENIQE